jgi:hypothetical protein
MKQDTDADYADEKRGTSHKPPGKRKETAGLRVRVIGFVGFDRPRAQVRGCTDTDSTGSPASVPQGGISPQTVSFL